jgi:predicted DNA-binding ribbon-helix-helix protein
MTEKVICPICKSEAEAINVGLFDGVGIRHVSTEDEFWDSVKEIAGERGMSLAP